MHQTRPLQTLPSLDSAHHAAGDGSMEGAASQAKPLPPPVGPPPGLPAPAVLPLGRLAPPPGPPPGFAGRLPPPMMPPPGFRTPMPPPAGGGGWFAACVYLQSACYCAAEVSIGIHGCCKLD